MMETGKYPNTVYRVTLKAIIRNNSGEVLLVKENGGTWSLPGGGIDHGEDDMVSLRRELLEEIAYDGEFEAHPISTASFFVKEQDRWLFWVVYEVKTQNNNFTVGKDADEIAFIDPRAFKGSAVRSEQLVYKTCVDPDAPFSYT